MSLLGKILLVINLLLGVAVVYLASQSFSKRDDTNIGLVKQELVSTGVPFEGSLEFATSPNASVPFPVVLGSGRSLTTIQGKVLADVFAGATRGGDLAGAQTAPPLSVMAEVGEIKKQLDAKVNSYNGNPAAGLAWSVGLSGNGRFIPGVLTLLADDFEERTIYRTWLEMATAEPNEAKRYYDLATAALAKKFLQATAKANPSEATAALEATTAAKVSFSEAYQNWNRAKITEINAANETLLQATENFWKAGVAPAPAASEIERKRIASSLLIHLDPTPGGQKRTALILGLGNYTRALSDRLERLKDTPGQIRDAMQRDINTFVVLYERDLQASRDLDRLNSVQKANTATLVAAAEEAKKAQALHAKLLTDAIARADDILTKVKARSVAQGELERDVFALQQQAGSLLSETFELHDRVYEVEQKRSGK